MEIVAKDMAAITLPTPVNKCLKILAIELKSHSKSLNL